jgi:hypothetical protein
MASNRARCPWTKGKQLDTVGRRRVAWKINATCLAFSIERSARVAGVVVRARDMSGAIDSGLQRRVRVEANRPPDEQLEHRDWIGKFREPFLDS